MDPMPKKYPHVLTEITRHGTKVFYYRRGKGPRIRLPSPGTEGFEQAYARCLASRPEPSRNATNGSLEWLILRYKESAHWSTLKPSTRQMRDNILHRVVKESGQVPYLAIQRKHINEAIDRRPVHAGNTFRKVMSQLFKWALSMDMVKVNPVDGANRHKITSDGFHTWSVAEVQRFYARWPVGTRERLAMDLALFTGLRRSDLYQLGRQHVSGGTITIRTVKTGAVVSLPIFPGLQASLDATPGADLAFLATSHGQPFQSAASFGHWFGEACKAAKVPGRLHGLRKAGATIAAEAGATAHELMSMYGWKRLSEAERYTTQANRQRMGAVTAERIANAFAPHLDPPAPHNGKPVKETGT
jgi:integrase